MPEQRVYVDLVGDLFHAGHVASTSASAPGRCWVVSRSEPVRFVTNHDR